MPFPVPRLLGAQNGPTGPNDSNDVTGPNVPNDDQDDQNNPTMNQCRHFIIKKKEKNIYYLLSYPVAILLLHVLLFSSHPAVTLSFG